MKKSNSLRSTLMTACPKRLSPRVLISLGAIVLIALNSFASDIGPLKGRVALSRALGLSFEVNKGQVRPEYRFVAHQNGLMVGVSDKSVDLTLSSKASIAHLIRLTWLSSDHESTLRGEELLAGQVNYLRGADSSKWITAVPTFQQVRYRDIYPGIDLLFYGNGSAIEHDFIVAPGSRPEMISLRIDGTNGVALSSTGDLVLGDSGGTIVLRKPVAYQKTKAGRIEVSTRFLVSGNVVSFATGDYDRTLPLVIDPVLDYSTYLTDDSTKPASVAADAQGNTYLTGYVFNAAYPTTTGVFQPTCASCSSTPDVFITKLKADGSGQIYSTFLGGTDYDEPFGLAVDASGNAIVVGRTQSADFPLKNPTNTGVAGYYATYGFVSSLSADGKTLNYSTLLGSPSEQNSSPETIVNAVAVDNSGNAYVTGTTRSLAFPVTLGALHAVTPGYSNTAVFVSKFLANGDLGYSAMIGDSLPQNGGVGPFGPGAIAVDAGGSAYIYGRAGTLWPITAGAYQGSIPETTHDAVPFVTKLSSDGSALVYSTFVGHAGGGKVAGIAVDNQGQAVLTGVTDDATYPTTADARIQSVTSSSYSWLTKLNATGTDLVYSSFLSSGSANASSLALDPSGNIWIAGSTHNRNFELVHPIQGTPGTDPYYSGYTGFISEYDSSGKSLLFSTYFGSPNQSTWIVGMVSDAQGNIHIAGRTKTGLYTTPGAFRTSTPENAYASADWGFAAKINASIASPALCLDSAYTNGVSFPNTPVGNGSTALLTISNCGEMPLSLLSIEMTDPVFSVPVAQNNCTGEIAAGASCNIVLRFEPTAAGSKQAELRFTTNAAIPKTLLPLSATGVASQIQVNPTQLRFDPLLVGQRSQAKTISVSSGTAAGLHMDLTKLTITGDFSYTQSGCGDLLPYRSCTIQVVYAPTAAGTRTGALTIVSDDPAHPTVTVSLSGNASLTYPIPLVSQLSQPTIPIGSESFEIWITGSDFYPVSMVRINGQAQQTTYSSPTTIHALIDPALRTGYGELTLTVSNPAPGGGDSAPEKLTLYRVVPVTPRFLVSVPSRNMLYVSVPSSAASNPNTVIPIDPSTGVAQTPIRVGNDPSVMAASEDGKYLYVACGTDRTIQRIRLETLTIDRTFAWPATNWTDSLPVREMHVMPGSPETLVVSVQDSIGTMALYNDAGLVNFVPSSYPGIQVDGFAFLDPTTVYSLPFTAVQHGYFNVFTIGSAGLQLTPITEPYNGSSYDTGTQVLTDGTLLYTSSGQVWNPVTKTQVATLPVTTFDTKVRPSLFNFVMDKSLGQLYAIGGQDYGQTYSTVLTAYDMTTLTASGLVAFPQTGILTRTLARWGTDGLAFIGPGSGASMTEDQVYLLRSGIVKTAVPAVTLSSSALTFSSQDIGTTSVAKFITLTNSGSIVLNIAGIVASGSFSATDNCGASLAVGASCQISVVFAPTTAGNSPGAVTITDNASGSPHIVTLSGTGVAPSFTIGSSGTNPTTATVRSGQTATYSLSVSGSPGFSGLLNLTCTGAPIYATCSISPSSVQLQRGSTGNFSVTVTTQQSPLAFVPKSTATPKTFALFVICVMSLCMVGRERKLTRMRKRDKLLIGMSLLLVAVFGMVSCGGGGSGTPTPKPNPVSTTPAGTYTLTITANAQSATASRSLTLIVQ